MNTRSFRPAARPALFGVGLAACLGLAAPPAATAGMGFTIKATGVSLTLGNTPDDKTGTAADGDLVVTGQNTLDHLSKTWWWYRLGADPREYAFSTDGVKWALNKAGDTAEADFKLADGVTARMSWFVNGPGNPPDGRGFLVTSVTVTNKTDKAVDLSLFHYLDLDLSGTPNDDSALWAPNAGFASRMRVNDKDAIAVYAVSNGARKGYAVDALPGVLDELTDAKKTTFADTGLGFNAGNWTGGYQWDVTAAAKGGEAKVGATVGIQVAPAIFAPEPSGTLMLAAGGLGLLASARRRRAAG